MDDTDRKQRIAELYRQRFGGEPEIWARAPGRVDLMGSHTDYNLGYIMTMPISRDTWIAAGNAGPRMRMYSTDLEDEAEADPEAYAAFTEKNVYRCANHMDYINKNGGIDRMMELRRLELNIDTEANAEATDG